MTEAKLCYLVYISIHDVMKAEAQFKRAGIWHDLVPTPREISSDCGMVVAVRVEDLEQIERALCLSDRQPDAVYWQTEAGYEEISY